MHAQPLAENDDLGAGLLVNLVQQGGQLVRLDAVVGLPVEQVAAVTRHAHVLERGHQPALVGLRQEAVAPPLLHDAGDDFAVVGVQLHLLRCHRHEEILVQPLGKLVEDLFLLAAKEYRLQGLADFVEARVADDLAVLIAKLMLVQQPVRRAEAVAIHKLHNRDQLFQPVLQRGAGQDDGVRRGDLFDTAGSARVPILDALGLVQDDEVRRPGLDQIKITVNRVVVHDLVESIAREMLLAACAESANHLGGALGELVDLALPLMLE